jgi:hypothetical protein
MICLEKNLKRPQRTWETSNKIVLRCTKQIHVLNLPFPFPIREFCTCLDKGVSDEARNQKWRNVLSRFRVAHLRNKIQLMILRLVKRHA